MTASLVLFAIEIIVMTVVADGFKYSFYFYLDIIATISLIFDVPDLMKPVFFMIGASTAKQNIDVVPGVLHSESQTQGKINQVIKSLRLIRLIRIIKLYKYVIGAVTRDGNTAEESNGKDEPKTRALGKYSKVGTTEKGDPAEEENQSKFRQETDPSKLGKNLSDRITREVIIGVLLMLMVLPLLSQTHFDFAKVYGLREVFMFGRSSCH
jgi:hypothetical protein